MVTSDIAVGPLVESIETKEVGSGIGGRGGVLGGPGEGGNIVAREPDRTLLDVTGDSQDVLVRDDASKFPVRDGEAAAAMVGRNQISANRVGERGTPEDGRCGRGEDIEPDPAHTKATGVTSASVRGGDGN